MRLSRIPLSAIALRREESIMERTDQLTPIAINNMGMNGLLWMSFLNFKKIIRNILSEEIPEVNLPTPIEIAKGYYSREAEPSEEEIVVKYVLDTMVGTMNLPKSLFYFKRILLEDAPYDVTIRSNVSHQLVVYSFSETAEDMNKQNECMKDLFKKIFKLVNLPVIFVPRSQVGEMSSKSIMSLYPNGEEKLLYYPSKKLWVDKNALFFEKEVLSFDSEDTILKKQGITRGLNSCEERSALKVGEFISWGHVKTRYKHFHFISPQAPFHVCKYMIDLSRAMDAIIYHNTGDSGFVWPYSLAPYKLHMICSPNRKEKAEYIYKEFRKKEISVLYDDRNIPFDEKFEYARLLGIPKIIVIDDNTRGSDGGLFEVDRATWKQEFSNYLEILKTPYRYM